MGSVLVERTKKCTRERLATLNWLLEMPENLFLQGDSPSAPVMFPLTWLHVWRLYGSCAAPKQTTPIVGDSGRCVLQVCLCSEPLSPYAPLEKAVYLCGNCGEWRAADCSLFVIKKNMFLIMEPLFFFPLCLMVSSFLLFFLLPPSELRS